MVGAEGKYMFVGEGVGWKQYLYLGLFVSIAFFFLLFKVWPDWLRVGVYYISWYLLVFLVSKSLLIHLDRNRHRPPYCLVHLVPYWHWLLDFPKLLHRFSKDPSLTCYRTTFWTRLGQFLMLSEERTCSILECCWWELLLLMQSSSAAPNSWKSLKT